MSTKTCPDCGSDKLMPNIKVRDNCDNFAAGDDLQVQLEGNPSAIFFREAMTTVVTATICGECGHMTLRADDPAALWQTWNKRND